jgi:hypothetical protein
VASRSGGAVDGMASGIREQGGGAWAAGLDDQTTVEAASGDAQRRTVCGDGWRRSGDRRRAGPRGLG